MWRAGLFSVTALDISEVKHKKTFEVIEETSRRDFLVLQPEIIEMGMARVRLRLFYALLFGYLIT